MEIIVNPIDQYFYQLCREAQHSIQLCAPFVKDNIISEIMKNKGEHVNVSLVTNININHIYSKSLDLTALKRIIECNGNVFNRGNLHAKYYIFDNEKLIITSGNLTLNGLSKNYEYGVLIDENQLVQKSSLDYDELIKDEDTREVQLTSINEIEKITNGIKVSKIKLPNINYIFDEDNQKNPIINSLSVENQLNQGWKKDVFHVIDQFEDDYFSINDLYEHENELFLLHQSNHNIKEKIRQILQQLRNLGLVEFVDKGKYKRLWIKYLDKTDTH